MTLRGRHRSIRRGILAFGAAAGVLIACGTLRAQDTLAFGKEALAQQAILAFSLQGPFPARYRYDAQFLSMQDDDGGAFTFLGPEGVHDATAAPARFSFRFRPLNARPHAGRARLLLRSYVLTTPLPIDSISVTLILTGDGVPLLAPARDIDVPAAAFVLFGIDRPMPAPGLDGVLSSTFGPYSVTEWRCFSYVPSLARYVEYSGPAGNTKHPSAFFTTFTQAASYFLISRIHRSFPLPAAMLFTLDSSTVRIEPGWNLVSSPYPYDVEWTAALRAAKLDGVISTARVLRGGEFVHPDSSDQLPSAEGAFVFSRAPQTVFITVVPSRFSSSKRTVPQEDRRWSLRVTLRAPRSRASCTLVATPAGFRETPLELPVPSVPWTAASIGLPAADGTALLEAAAVDSGSGLVRDLTVVMSDLDVPADITAEGMDGLPEGYSIIIADPEDGARADVTRGGAFTIHGSGRRTLRLIAGTSAFIRAHEQAPRTGSLAMACDILPVPVRDIAIFRVRLPEPRRIRITMADLLGRRISQAVREECDGGIHDISIDLASVPAGVYVACIDAGGTHRITRTVMVLP